MNTVGNVDEYFRVMAEERLFRSERNLRFHQRALFDDVDFSGKSMLDVGAGPGLMGFYAACNGAREVVCLEPEADGSTKGVQKQFQRAKDRLGLDNIRMETEFLQSWDPRGQTFDIILLHNSVNHLDEDACVSLLDSEQARRRYEAIFGKLSELAKPGGKIIVNDCSRYNLFATLRMRSPIMPTIEWEKHQAPEVWANLLSKVGFENPRIRWSSFNRLGRTGQLLLGSKAMAYLLKSHFWLTMDKARLH